MGFNSPFNNETHESREVVAAGRVGCFVHNTFEYYTPKKHGGLHE
jgi:hypothetical protein